MKRNNFKIWLKPLKRKRLNAHPFYLLIQIFIFYHLCLLNIHSKYYLYINIYTLNGIIYNDVLDIVPIASINFTIRKILLITFFILIL